jgi:cytochrome P450
VEEILRYSPSIVTWRRRSTEEAVIDGVTLSKGADILLVMASGNRDEAQFPNGETFDIISNLVILEALFLFYN